MRKPGTLVLLSLFALLAFLSTTSDAQTRAVRRLGDVKSIYVDRSSFDITYAECSKMVNGVWEPCKSAKKQRVKFLDALERWIGKYGINIAKDPMSADATLRGTISMEEHQTDYDPLKLKNRSRGDILEAADLADWDVEAWLENSAGRSLWQTGQASAPKPAYGFSTIDKVEAKELAKEIEYSIRKDR